MKKLGTKNPMEQKMSDALVKKLNIKNPIERKIFNTLFFLAMAVFSKTTSLIEKFKAIRPEWMKIKSQIARRIIGTIIFLTISISIVLAFSYGVGRLLSILDGITTTGFAGDVLLGILSIAFLSCTLVPLVALFMIASIKGFCALLFEVYQGGTWVGDFIFNGSPVVQSNKT